MTKNPTILRVVAGALRRGDGRWLMHRRPHGKHLGGLWEFPGGKLEVSESPREALQRELAEELGIAIAIDSLELAAVARDDTQISSNPIVIELYTATSWQGEPRALEGGEIAWLAPAQVLKLGLAPLDIELANKLFCDLA